MTDRDARIDRLVIAAGCGGWHRTPIAGDASARQYLRLTGPEGRRAVLMDAPPDTAGDQTAFLSIAAHLRDHGLAAPEILAADPGAGLILMTDLGPVDFAAHLAACPADEDALTEAAIDVLARLGELPLPPGLTVLTPETGAAMLEPLADWYAPGLAGPALDDLGGRMAEALSTLARPPVVLSLRDFHAGNLIWRPEHTGTDRVGLLDFQDAFAAPPAYDLISYLHDARRDLPDPVRARAMARFARLTDTPADLLAAEAAVLSLQRNLRILGIFARLARRDGKTRYLAFLPRVWGHVREALSHPALASLRPGIEDRLPAPDAAHLARLGEAP